MFIYIYLSIYIDRYEEHLRRGGREVSHRDEDKVVLHSVAQRWHRELARGDAVVPDIAVQALYPVPNTIAAHHAASREVWGSGGVRRLSPVPTPSLHEQGKRG